MQTYFFFLSTRKQLNIALIQIFVNHLATKSSQLRDVKVLGGQIASKQINEWCTKIVSSEPFSLLQDFPKMFSNETENCKYLMLIET
jgi:hypothetical protein